MTRSLLQQAQDEMENGDWCFCKKRRINNLVCNGCGGDLEVRDQGKDSVSVIPCAECLTVEKIQSHDEGYAEAVEVAAREWEEENKK